MLVRHFDRPEVSLRYQRHKPRARCDDLRVGPAPVHEQGKGARLFLGRLSRTRRVKARLVRVVGVRMPIYGSLNATAADGSEFGIIENTLRRWVNQTDVGARVGATSARVRPSRASGRRRSRSLPRVARKASREMPARGGCGETGQRGLDQRVPSGARACTSDGGTRMTTTTNEGRSVHFDPQRTALLVIDPVNDFLDEDGGAWAMTKSTVKKNA